MLKSLGVPHPAVEIGLFKAKGVVHNNVLCLQCSIHDTLPHCCLQVALEEIVSIGEEGGVIVRRDGDGRLKRWNYGYRCLAFLTVTFAARAHTAGNTTFSSTKGRINNPTFGL